jgi:cytidylate kinase
MASFFACYERTPVNTARRAPIVAIDGPAGAGKSTVARRLADTMGYVLVDTGALYRGVALAARHAGVSWEDGERVGALARSLVERHGLWLERSAAGLRVRLYGEDVSDAIRTPDLGMGASQVSAHASVRGALLEMQRQAGRPGGVVLEGRDIGTVVFPRADVKFFLTARPEVRARRRFDELRAKGSGVSYEETLADVRQRDEQDTTRAVAPLRQASDAVLVDSSEMSIDDTVSKMAAHIVRVGDTG